MEIGKRSVKIVIKFFCILPFDDANWGSLIVEASLYINYRGILSKAASLRQYNWGSLFGQLRNPPETKYLAWGTEGQNWKLWSIHEIDLQSEKFLKDPVWAPKDWEHRELALAISYLLKTKSENNRKLN
jgi:hypothetical protein